MNAYPMIEACAARQHNDKYTERWFASVCECGALKWAAYKMCATCTIREFLS